MRKMFRNYVTALILIAFVVTGTVAVGAAAQPAFAAAKPALAAKKITMDAGMQATLRVKHPGKKIKWISDNPFLVEIIKTKGKFHQTAVLRAADKSGTCVIRAKAGKKLLKCTVTVNFDPNAKIEIRDISDTSVDLTKGLSQGEPVTADPASDEGKIFNEAAADFAVKLMQQTLSQEAAKAQAQGSGNTGEPVNVLISPQSVMTALAMTGNGAANGTLSAMEKTLAGTAANGQPRLTEEQFDQYLSLMNKRLTSIDPQHVIYTEANSIWARKDYVDVKQSFLQKNKDRHNASFYEAPFDSQTVADINNWVYNNTRNMIDKIISELSEDCRMILINTIAFEGKWAEPFYDGQVDDKGTFTTASGTKQDAVMLKGRMHSDAKPYIQVAGGDGFVRNYVGGEIAFVGILPPEGTSVDKFVAGLSGQDFIKAWAERSDVYDVDMKLPEFKLDYFTSMTDPLKAMGMGVAFTDFADFSEMIIPTAQTEAAKISDVLHKTHIELDRNGTKAAAVTAVIVDKATSIGPGNPPPVKQVYLDKPFVYALVDTETGIPIFLGTMNSMK